MNILSDQRVSIVEMVKNSNFKKNRLALAVGFTLGGWIPIVTYLISHLEVQEIPALWLLMAGGLTYSAMTVFTWANVAFSHPLKALGFVVLMEGAMTFVPNPFIGIPSLILLVMINGLATANNLIRDSQTPQLNPSNLKVIRNRKEQYGHPNQKSQRPSSPSRSGVGLLG